MLAPKPESTHELGRPLIVDHDINFLASLIGHPKAEQIKPHTTTSGKQAQLIITNPKNRIVAIFINIQLPDNYSLSVIRCAHLCRPSVPIFFLREIGQEMPWTDKEVHKLGISEVIVKPVQYHDLLARFSAPSLLFDAVKLLDEGSADQDDTVDDATLSDDSEFVPIRAINFVSGTKSFFNVYVRVGDRRYLRILHAGDAFSPDRVIQYVHKGVIHFYLKKTGQEQYIRYCDKLASTLISKRQPIEMTHVALTLNHGEETIKFLERNGVSESHLKHAEAYVTNVSQLVKSTGMDKLSIFKDFLEDIVAYEHGVATALIAAILGKHFHFDSQMSSRILGLASLFHDIGLIQMEPELRSENMSLIPDDLLEKYKTHPLIGAQILDRVRGIESSVGNAIAWHHGRRNRAGFPKLIEGGMINRVAELVGISDEFVKLIAESKKIPILNPYVEMEKTVFEGFSYPIVDAFRKVFMQNPWAKYVA